MGIAQTAGPTRRKPLRLWPGVVAAVRLWLARFGIKAVVPGSKGFGWAAQGGRRRWQRRRAPQRATF